MKKVIILAIILLLICSCETGMKSDSNSEGNFIVSDLIIEQNLTFSQPNLESNFTNLDLNDFNISGKF